MGYTHYLRNANLLTPEEFYLLRGVAAEVVVEWAKRFTGALACLESFGDFEPSETMIEILRSDLSDAKKAVRLEALWKANGQIFVIFRDCESINIRPGEEFEFCKTRQIDPADTLTVAVFWLAHLVNDAVEFSSDGYDWETAEGRAFAERMWHWSDMRRIFEEAKQDGDKEE